jgi:hypothetical protein
VHEKRKGNLFLSLANPPLIIDINDFLRVLGCGSGIIGDQIEGFIHILDRSNDTKSFPEEQRLQGMAPEGRKSGPSCGKDGEKTGSDQVANKPEVITPTDCVNGLAAEIATNDYLPFPVLAHATGKQAGKGTAIGREDIWPRFAGQGFQGFSNSAHHG